MRLIHLDNLPPPGTLLVGRGDSHLLVLTLETPVRSVIDGFTALPYGPHEFIYSCKAWYLRERRRVPAPNISYLRMEFLSDPLSIYTVCVGWAYQDDGED